VASREGRPGATRGPAGALDVRGPAHVERGWTAVFFALERPGWALVEIVILFVAVAVSTVLFARLDDIAGWLMAPYLVWVAFATALTTAIAVLN
jgi:tryptophan-rich sensory protein